MPARIRLPSVGPLAARLRPASAAVRRPPCRLSAPALNAAKRWTSSSSSSSLSSSVDTPEKPYYITTPIFYVNADPHVGHLYTMVLTDILKRWQELRGKRARLCTGTDEHGMKIQQAALLADSAPQAFCDAGAQVFKNLATQANVSFDVFLRTTAAEHRETVQYFWELLVNRDYIYLGRHEGWYSVSDETFYPASAIEQVVDAATGRKLLASRETGKVVEWTSETNYHFRLSALAPALLRFYAQNPAWVCPASRHAEVVAAVEAGLDDLSVSRPVERLSWGVPVPLDPGQTIYVWLDALVNYLTASGYPWRPGRESALGWPADVHVVGKDIVKFHCIYWPAFLLALDLPLPRRVLSHAHWTMNRRKMSKSSGNVVNPFYAIQRFGVDAMRFYMAHDGGIVDDGDYSNERIVERYKNCLQGGLGNLVARILSSVFDIADARRQGLAGDVPYEEQDQALREMVETVRERVEDRMQRLDVPGALRDAMDVVYETNKYIQQTQPWKLVNPGQKQAQHKIVFLAAEAVRVASILLQPFMPDKIAAVLDHLNVAPDRRGIEFAQLGRDDAYGEGTSGRKTMVFPPLSE